jgi:apolipoprotein D and lipocalin family protein
LEKLVMLKSGLEILLWSLLTSLSVSAQALPNEPVTRLDLNRYVGTWHEIAHLPLYFQRQCVDNITATYTRQVDGTIGVHNACRTKNGSMDVADGIARKTDGPAGALQVRFAPSWLGWLPFVWADYWVVDLDSDYQWVVVGSPSRKYLWVLSRAPAMSRVLFEQLRRRAAERGYPVDKLIMAGSLD